MAGNARKPATSVAIALLGASLTVPVSGRVPNPRPAKFVRVVRVGGVKRNLVTDSPMLTFECWAPNDVAAESLAGQVADLLEQSPGGFVTYRDEDGADKRAWITDHYEVGGPVNNPDMDVTNQARWTLTVGLDISTNV